MPCFKRTIRPSCLGDRLLTGCHILSSTDVGGGDMRFLLASVLVLFAVSFEAGAAATAAATEAASTATASTAVKPAAAPKRPGTVECDDFQVKGIKKIKGIKGIKGIKEVNGVACVHHADRSKNPDILWFFHGATGNEGNWGDPEYEEYVQIRERWKQRNLAPPTVISVSFGEHWMLTAPWGRSPGLMKVFVELVMPNLERYAGGLGPGRRLLLGNSMGGYNASVMYLKHSDLFARVAAVCPAITTISPFASKSELWDYSRRTGANVLWVYHFMGIAGDLIGDEEAWPANDTLAIAKSVLKTNVRRPPFYISCGYEDELGFFEGASYLAKLVGEAKFPLRWQPMEGGHCPMDTTAVADFLMER